MRINSVGILSSFFNALFVDTEKTVILDVVNEAYSNLSEFNQRMFEMADGMVSKETSVYKRHYLALKRYLGNEDLVRGIFLLNEHILDQQSLLTEMVDQTFNDNITKESIDVKKATLLQYGYVLNYYTLYSRYLVRSLVTTTVMNDGLKPDESASSALRFVKDHETFVRCVSALTRSAKDLEKGLSKMNGVRIPKSEEEMKAKGLLEREVNPLRVALSLKIFHPIYQLGLLYNDYVKLRHDTAHEEIARMSEEIELLKDQKEEALTPKAKEAIEKRIGYYGRQISRNQAKIKNIEEKAGV